MLISREGVNVKNSHEGRSQPAESGSQECSPWDPTSGFLGKPRHSGERRGCSGRCNSGPGGENESLIAFRETTNTGGEVKPTVVIHRLVCSDLWTNEIHTLQKENKLTYND